MGEGWPQRLKEHKGEREGLRLEAGNLLAAKERGNTKDKKNIHKIMRGETNEMIWSREIRFFHNRYARVSPSNFWELRFHHQGHKEHKEKKKQTETIWSRELICKRVWKWNLYSKSCPAHRAGVTDPIVFFSILRLAKCLCYKNNTNPAARCVAGRLVKISEKGEKSVTH